MGLIIGLIIFYLIYRAIKKTSANNKKPLPVKTNAPVQFQIPSFNENGIDNAPQDQSRDKMAKWYNANQRISINGYDISVGLIYVGEKLPDAYGYANDACLINPKLKVSPAKAEESSNEISYWPNYGEIPASCRGVYLKWLAEGRCEPKTNIGYVFLFFYGLERRLFVDGLKNTISENERTEIVQEVIRLLNIYGENHSFRGYANNFLAMEWVFYQSEKPPPAYIDFKNRYCVEPFQVALAQYVVAGKLIPAEIALNWIMLHPEFGLRTPARRCENEFHELFTQRYKKQFGDGLLVKPNKTQLKVGYHPASPSLEHDIKHKIPALPNPFILTGPLKKISGLIEECTKELEPYSRFLAKKVNEFNSITRWALLPSELIYQIPTLEKLQLFLAQTCSNGQKLIFLNELYNNLGVKIPDQISKRELKSLIVLLGKMGFGMVPNAHFCNIKLNIDSKIAILSNERGLDLKPSKDFQILVTILRLGAVVSQINNQFSSAKEAILKNLIYDTPELNLTEKNYLLAFLCWCLNTPQNISGIKQVLGKVSFAEKTAISHILISVAYADGHINADEIKQLEKLYLILGLEKAQVTSDLHALAAISGPVTIGLRDPVTSFAIPKPEVDLLEPKSFRLNEELIRIREEETRQVRGVLEHIFSDADADEQINFESTPSITQVENPLSHLDQAHQSFFHRLSERETWERSAVRELCKELGLMMDGAMETLNEWAFDNANAILIEDGDPIFVDISLAKEITDV